MSISLPSLKSKLVSVIIPSYNHAEFIVECIKSVVDQDYPCIELVVIDDGSIDDSTSKVEALKKLCVDRFVRFELRVRENRGLASTLNEGLAWAKGDFICALASDDFWYSNKISAQIDFFERHPNNVMCAGVVDVVDSLSRVVKRGSERLATVYSHNDIALFNYSMPAATFMYKSESIKAIGGFSRDVLVEDFYILLSLTARGCEVANIGRVVAAYRRHPKNSSAMFFERHSVDRLCTIDKLVEGDLKEQSAFISTCIFSTQLLGFDKARAISLLIRSIRPRYLRSGLFRVLRFGLLFFVPKPVVRKVLWVSH